MGSSPDAKKNQGDQGFPSMDAHSPHQLADKQKRHRDDDGVNAARLRVKLPPGPNAPMIVTKTAKAWMTPKQAIAIQAATELAAIGCDVSAHVSGVSRTESSIAALHS